MLLWAMHRSGFQLSTLRNLLNERMYDVFLLGFISPLHAVFLSTGVLTNSAKIVSTNGIYLLLRGLYRLEIKYQPLWLLHLVTMYWTTASML